MLTDNVLLFSQLQLSITVLLHLFFVPLTVGIATLMAFLALAYQVTNQQAYRESQAFWARLFAINFIFFAATKLFLIITLGASLSNLSRYVGDLIAIPLTLDCVTGFFMASCLFHPFWFGWFQLQKTVHNLITVLLAVTLNLSLLFSISTYNWMKHPMGGEFNPKSLRFELTDIQLLLNNPTLLQDTIHYMGISYLVAAGTILTISIWIHSQNTHQTISHKVIKGSAIVGLISLLLVSMHGNPSSPDLASTLRNQRFQGVNTLPEISSVEQHILSGQQGFLTLEKWRDDIGNTDLPEKFNTEKQDLGYALLLKKITPSINSATEYQRNLVAQATITSLPGILPWLHKFIQIVTIFCFLLLVFCLFNVIRSSKWTQSLLPLVWSIALLDAFTSRAGYQPWLITEVLPEFLGFSTPNFSVTLIYLATASLILAVYAAVHYFLSLRFVHTFVNNGSQS